MKFSEEGAYRCVSEEGGNVVSRALGGCFKRLERFGVRSLALARFSELQAVNPLIYHGLLELKLPPGNPSQS